MSASKMIATAAAVAFGALGLAGSASAAEVFIAGSVYWNPLGSPNPAPISAYSSPNEISNFSFDVNQPLPNTTPGATAVNVTNFSYTLNNAPVTTPLSAVVFWNSSFGGMFDIDFNDGNAVSISGANIGNIDGSWLIGPPGNYQVTAALNDTTPPTGSGNVVVSVVSPVPLPAALPLFGAALAGLGAFGWRKGRRKTA